MKKMSVFLLAVFVFIIPSLMIGCNPPGNSDDESTPTARLVTPNWTEGVAYSYVAKTVLESQMGYNCTVTTEPDVAACFSSISNGTQDAMMEVWSNLHSNYVSNHGSDISQLGMIYSEAKSGLVVPQYVYDDGMTAIGNLETDQYETNLSSEIQGIDASAGIMDKVENEVLTGTYNINANAGYTLLEGDTTTMLSALDTAISNNEWIVVTLWKPHWAFGEYDLAFLEDSQTVFGEDDIYIYSRAGLTSDDPELAQFLTNMTLTDAQMANLLAHVHQSSSSTETAAAEWTANNSTLVESWVP